MAQTCDLYFCYKLYVRRMVQSCKMFFCWWHCVGCCRWMIAGLPKWKNFAKELFHKVLSGSGSMVLCRKCQKMRFEPSLLRVVCRGRSGKKLVPSSRAAPRVGESLGASKGGWVRRKWVFNQIYIFARSCMFVAWCSLVSFFFFVVALCWML